MSFPPTFFFLAHWEEKEEKGRKKAKKKPKKSSTKRKEKKKEKMEGEVLGQANYPYILLLGSVLVCIAVIMIGFNM